MDEDVEFRDMVLKRLEENGSLLEIKAKLRAYLYDVIENDGKASTAEVIHDTDLTYNNSSSGSATDKSEVDEDDRREEPDQEMDDRSLALGLVFDLLDCLKLPYTKKVLSAETGVQRPCTRVRLKREFLRNSSGEVGDSGSEAILLQLIEQNRKRSTPGESTSGGDVSQITGAITSYLIILIQFNLAALQKAGNATEAANLSATTVAPLLNLSTTVAPLLNLSTTALSTYVANP